MTAPFSADSMYEIGPNSSFFLSSSATAECMLFNVPSRQWSRTYGLTNVGEREFSSIVEHIL